MAMTRHATCGDIDDKIALAKDEIVVLIEELRGLISAISLVVAGKIDAANVYTKTESVERMDAHKGDTDLHVTAQKQELWNSKYGSDEAYSKAQCNELFAPASVAATVADMQNDVALKANTYTKTEVNNLVKAMKNKSFDYGDWSNGALADAVKALYTALGGTIINGDAVH